MRRRENNVRGVTALLIWANFVGQTSRSASWRGLRPRAESETPQTGRPETCPTNGKMTITGGVRIIGVVYFVRPFTVVLIL
jgi:hypothetical protein